MSKAQPIAPPASAASTAASPQSGQDAQSPAPLFDMSKAQPIQAENKPSTGESMLAGIEQTGGDIWNVVKKFSEQGPMEAAAKIVTSGGAVGAGKELYQHIKETIPVFEAYEKARSSGRSVVDSLSAANDQAAQQEVTRQELMKRVEDFRKNPTQAATRAVGDAAAAALAMWGTGKLAGALMPEVGASAAAEGAETATPAAETAEAAATPKPGIIQQVLKGEKAAQPQAQEAMRGAAGATPGTELRESLTNPIDEAEKQGDELYHKIDTASGTDFKGLNAKLKVVNRAIRNSVDDSEEARLTARRDNIEATIEQGKKTALENGVDPGTINQADTQFKRMSALTDVEKKVFKNVNVIDPTTGDVNIPTAVKELQKLQDSEKFGAPRLDQALGKGNTLLQDMKAANRLGIQSMKRQEFAKILAKYVGVPAAAGVAAAGYEAMK